MKFPTFVAVFLLTVVALSVPFVSSAVERSRDDGDRSRPSDGQEEQTPREDNSAPEREQDEEPPRGGVVYNKNGIVIHVDEGPESTTVTVSVDGKVASKVTHSGSSDGNNGGNDAGPGEDGQDGQDGSPNNNDGGGDNNPTDDDDGRTDRDRDRTR